LATALPGYEAAMTVPVLVSTRGPYRPMITPDSTFDHPLVRDFHGGVTRREAELRIRAFQLQDPLSRHAFPGPPPTVIAGRAWWRRRTPRSVPATVRRPRGGLD